MTLNFEARPIEAITPDDTHQHCLWRFVSSRDGRIWVRPLKAKKAKNFVATLVSTKVVCADGTVLDALLEGIDTETPEYSRHYRQLHVWIANEKFWFCLAKHDDGLPTINDRGFDVLARLLKKNLQQTSPIKFDITAVCTLPSTALTGSFEINPSWRVSREHLMEILVNELKQ